MLLSEIDRVWYSRKAKREEETSDDEGERAEGEDEQEGEELKGSQLQTVNSFKQKQDRMKKIMVESVETERERLSVFKSLAAALANKANIDISDKKADRQRVEERFKTVTEFCDSVKGMREHERKALIDYLGDENVSLVVSLTDGDFDAIKNDMHESNLIMRPACSRDFNVPP